MVEKNIKDCLICNRILKIKTGKNPYFVKELKTGYVVIGDFQYYKGYVLFLAKNHVEELHELDARIRLLFLKEMSQVAEAVWKAFNPKKLNYELLGNSEPHLHWHIFPRYENDPNPKEPIWVINKNIRRNGKTKSTLKQIAKMRDSLLDYLH